MEADEYGPVVIEIWSNSSVCPVGRGACPNNLRCQAELASTSFTPMIATCASSHTHLADG
jgi:hypothetical protein